MFPSQAQTAPSVLVRATTGDDRSGHGREVSEPRTASEASTIMAESRSDSAFSLSQPGALDSAALAPGAADVCAPDTPPAPEPLSEPDQPEEQDAEDFHIPEWFRADLPRMCRACRDYRPSTDGQRGWCANTWAFTHRRLVQGDDIAPCHSAIGDWWVPVDDVWLVAADVSAHGRATPLLDRLVGQDSAHRRRS
jgi:hypothetical protein